MNNSWNDTIQQGVKHLKNNDPILREVINSYPLPQFSPHTNYYQELVESIVSQQLSVKAAAAILKRFKNIFSADFPSPDDILSKDIETFRSAGLSRQKATYIQDLAEKVKSGAVTFNQLDKLSNEAIIEELTKIKGVGVWTVHMFLMFCMGRLDVFPTGDLGIRNGIQKLYDCNDKPTAEEMELIARNNSWHPYETIASWYVWQSLDNTPAIEQVIEEN